MSAPPEGPPPDDAQGAPPSWRARAILLVAAIVVVAAIGFVTWFAVHDNGSSTPSSVPGATVDPIGQIGPSSAPGVAKVGDLAPDFNLETLDGSTVRLSDLRGTPVVLNFWASWCAPCRKEFPLLRDAAKNANGRYVVVGVDTSDIRSDGRSFAREQQAHWPNGFDVDQGVAKSYGVIGKPQTFFIDADGRIVARVPSELTRATIDRNVAELTHTR